MKYNKRLTTVDNLLSHKTTETLLYCFNRETPQELANLREGPKRTRQSPRVWKLARTTLRTSCVVNSFKLVQSEQISSNKTSISSIKIIRVAEVLFMTILICKFIDNPLLTNLCYQDMITLRKMESTWAIGLLVVWSTTICQKCPLLFDLWKVNFRTIKYVYQVQVWVFDYVTGKVGGTA